MNRLHAGASIDVQGLRVIPVERTRTSADRIMGFLTAAGAKEPVAVVFLSPGGARAVDLDGREISLTALLRDVEGLRDALS